MINSLQDCLDGFYGHVALSFTDLRDGEEYGKNEQDQFKAASLIKIPLVLKIGELIRAKKYTTDSRIPIKKRNRVGGTGIFQFLSPQYEPTLEELIFFAISQSDNSATNELIDLCGGFASVQEFMHRKGLNHSCIQRKMMDLEAVGRGEENRITTEDINLLLIETITKIMKSSSSSVGDQLLWKSMKMQQCRNKLPVDVPAMDSFDVVDKDTPIEGKVLVANKTGDLWTSQHDAGIFVLPNGRIYTLVVCTDGLKKAQDGCQLISKISNIVYNYEKEKE